MTNTFWKLIKQHKIEIPLIQRDYAQGRTIDKVPAIRARFLKDISEAISVQGQPLQLDFIYGYTKPYASKEIDLSLFTPLDGQQRLTTLFLLHWYVAVKSCAIQDVQNLLLRFTYETRHSSRVFCTHLVKFLPNNFETNLRETIINQSWFFAAWIHDPTISSMLVMLEDIQSMMVKHDAEVVWSRLIADQSAIEFHLLPMEKLGLPDDLYIKMNSRGKQLTDFEHFKSIFPEILDSESSNRFNECVDREWSDLFYNFYKDEVDVDIAKLVDDGFLRFFNYVTDMLRFITEEDIADEIDEGSKHGYEDVFNLAANVDFYLSCLDIFTRLYLGNKNFFTDVFYVEQYDFEHGKTRLFFDNSQVDLFKKCVDSYDPTKRTNPFSIGEQLMLFGCILSLKHESDDFLNRIRVLRNLINNSGDEVRRENMRDLLSATKELILNGEFEVESKFNKLQKDEERNKKFVLNSGFISEECIYRLEDHELLQGCISIVKLDENFDARSIMFAEIFSDDYSYETISRALLTIGDYSQSIDDRRRFGGDNNPGWREIFTPSLRKGRFGNTRDILCNLLDLVIGGTGLDQLIEDYLASFNIDIFKPKDFRYYFIKYDSFRYWGERATEGYFSWNYSEVSRPYEPTMLFKSNFRGRHWSPFLLAIKDASLTVSLDVWNSPLVIVKGNHALKVRNINKGFKFSADSEQDIEWLDQLKSDGLINEEDMILVNQNEAGLDTEDRIEKAIAFIAALPNKVTTLVQ